MVKKSISITEQQDSWIKAQMETGHFGNESEVIRELIRERQLRQQEPGMDIEALRQALIEGEQGGRSELDIDQIWSEVRENSSPRHG